jgi:hypothetical protein
MKLVVVILVGMLILFSVGAGVAFGKPRTKKPADSKKEASTRTPTPFEHFLAKLSLPSGSPSPLQKSVYRAGDQDETIGHADSIRRVKFQLTKSEKCDIEIHYTDKDSNDHDLRDQLTHLTRHKEEGTDDRKSETTLVVLTTGGKITFGPCGFHKNGPCPGRLEVVK